MKRSSPLTTQETTCPFCAELIKQEAIRCKHCHADLSNKIVIPAGQSLPSEKKGRAKNILLWIILLPLLAFGALLVIGAMSSPPTAQDQARAAIELCWKDFDDPLKSKSTKQFVRDACHGMINKYEAQYGRSASLRRD
jgi:hypothetical protein